MSPLIKILLLLLPFTVSASLQHSKSYYINDQAIYVRSFVVQDRYVYITTSNTIVQRDFDSTEVVRTFVGHVTEVYDLIIFNNTMVSGSSDGMLIQWALKSGTILNRLKTKCDIDHLVVFGESCVLSCQTFTSLLVDLKLFELQQSSIFEEIDEQFYVYGDVLYGFFSNTIEGVTCYQKNFTKSIVFGSSVSVMIRTGQIVYAADRNTYNILELNLLPESTSTLTFTGPGHQDYVPTMSISNQFLITGGYDFQVILWNITARAQLRSINTATVQRIVTYNETSFLYASASGDVYLMNIQSLSYLKNFGGRRIMLKSLVINDDFFYTGSDANEIKQWSISTKELQGTRFNNSFSNSLFIDKSVIMSCNDSIMVFDLSTTKLLKEFAIREVNCEFVFYYLEGFVYAVAYDYHNIVNKYNLTDSSMILQFKDSTIWEKAISIFAIESYIFVAYTPKVFAQWDSNLGNLLSKNSVNNRMFWTSYNGKVLCANLYIYVITPSTYKYELFYNAGFEVGSILYDGSSGILFASGLVDCIIRGFDVQNSFATVYYFAGHTGIIDTVVINGNFLFSSSEDGTVKQWSLVTKRITYSFEDKAKCVVSLVCFNNSLVFATVKGEIYEFEISSALWRRSFYLNHNKITSTVFNHDLLFFAQDRAISILMASNLSNVYQLDMMFAVQCIYVSKGLIYVGLSDFSIVQYNYTSGTKIKAFFGHDAVINDVLIVDTKIFSAGSDGLICKWDIKTLLVELKFKGHTDQVSSILTIGDSLISSSYDKSIIIWDIYKGFIKKILKRTAFVLGHLGPINQIKFCGGDLFSASSDWTIKRWNINDGAVIDTLFGHQKQVNCLYCFNYAIFSGSDDFTVFLWYPEFNLQSSSYASSRSTSSYFISSHQNETGNSVDTNSLYLVIIGVICIFLVVMGCVVYFLRSKRKSIKQSQTSKTDDITKEKSSEISVTGSTLFTQALGISIPGYLELNSTSFRLLKQIAKGGGGSIYLAEIFSKKEKFIAKVFSDNYSNSNELMKIAFDQEITLMEYLKSHKNIAKIVGFCRSPCALLMKFYDKGSLGQLIRSGNHLKFNKYTRYLFDICLGIQFMHSKNIIHGDLKPDNILIDIDENGEFLVLTDFGISHIFGTDQLATEQFKIANLRGLSVHYAAPELFKRFRFKEKEFDVVKAKSVDVYAFALIMYETITRHHPWC